MNMQALMRQAQTMQKDMLKAKDEIDKMIFNGHSSLVTVTLNGKKDVQKVEITNKDEIEKEDLEVLEDMIVVAMNDALQQVDKETEQKMGKYANAMPGLF
ncbi:MAG: YbaB/EbfC family nucleoid-associated protein [Bacilli bacterium]